VNRSRSRRWGALLAALVLGAATLGCSSADDGSALAASRTGRSDAESASSCQELVDAAAELTQRIVHDLQGKTIEDLRTANPEDPWAPLLEPFEAFQDRAETLGCDRAQLRRLACPAYQSIEPNGPVSEEFLSMVPDTDC
jgi:hypothetical protein